VNTPSLGRLVVAVAVATAAAVLSVPGASAAAPQPFVRAINFDTDVNPVTAGYVKRELESAQADGARAAVIVLDTPGGLSTSMHNIVKYELGTKIPVIVYVPQGSRAASAGVWISQAADLLAMAPSANIGSSTPIDTSGGNLGSDLRRKAINDAAASLRALAKTHGRNVAWADAAVRKASNLTAGEALRRHVIDMVAPTLSALLVKANGVRTKPRGFVLQTAGTRVESVHMSTWERIRNTLIDPNIIVILLSLGTLGVIAEFWMPGHIFPGTFGAIALILAFYGLSVLPISWAGLLLMLLAFGFFAGDFFVPTHGAFTLAGAVSFVFGGLLLFDPAGPSYSVSLPLLLAIAGTLVAAFLLVIAKVVRIRRSPATTGVSTLVGRTGEVRPGGLVFLNGELWQATAVAGEAALVPGQLVEVAAVEGLLLRVRPLKQAPAQRQPLLETLAGTPPEPNGRGESAAEAAAKPLTES
jgi:membrane-bound serine protease (ClpP class)